MHGTKRGCSAGFMRGGEPDAIGVETSIYGTGNSGNLANKRGALGLHMCKNLKLAAVMPR